MRELIGEVIWLEIVVTFIDNYMRRFKTWIEPLLEDNQVITGRQKDEVEGLYNKVVDLLLGGAKKELNLSISDIEADDAAPGKPPTSKGAHVVEKKLEKAGIFQKLQQINPELRQRAIDTQNHLNKIGSDQKIGPKDTVGGLLNMLFGPNAVAKYSKGLSTPTPQPTDHKPENNQAQTPDAIAPPAAGEQPDTSPPMGGPGMPPMGGPGMPPMGGPGMPPMGGPGMPPMGGPGMPLQSPGGPMPPMPPGGMF